MAITRQSIFDLHREMFAAASVTDNLVDQGRQSCGPRRSFHLPRSNRPDWMSRGFVFNSLDAAGSARRPPSPFVVTLPNLANANERRDRPCQQRGVKGSDYEQYRAEFRCTGPNQYQNWPEKQESGKLEPDETGRNSIANAFRSTVGEADRDHRKEEKGTQKKQNCIEGQALPCPRIGAQCEAGDFEKNQPRDRPGNHRDIDPSQFRRVGLVSLSPSTWSVIVSYTSNERNCISYAIIYSKTIAPIQGRSIWLIPS